MTGLTSAQLLDAWERALPLPAAGRPLVLLAAASITAGGGDGSAGLAAAAALPVGVRDGRLLDLLAATFGARLEAVASCPACGESLEVSCTVGKLRAGPPSGTDILSVDGYELHVRLPDSNDVAALAGFEDPEPACLEVLRRCVTVLSRPAESGAGDRLPESVVDAVEEALLALDPQAEVLLAIECEACRHRWRAALDVGAFLWVQVDGYARRCAAEVHSLARAYGWREADILAMSPWRRALYLELVGP
jgi:hypothetical protein